MFMRLSFSLVLVAVVSQGCRCSDENPVAPQPTRNERVTVRLKWLHTASFAEQYAARERGFFQKVGLDVDLRPGGFEMDPVRLVAGGSDDIGIIGADTLLLARSKGIPLVAVGVVFQSSPGGFVVRSDSTITSPKDFVGRRVGIKPGTDIETIYVALLARLGIDRGGIREIPMKFDVQPFVAGVIDVLPTYVTNDPYLLEEKGIPVRVVRPEDYGVSLYGMVYVVTESTLRKRSEMVQRFLDASVQGWLWAMANRDEATRLVLRYADKLTFPHQRKMLDSLAPLVGDRPGVMDPQGWLRTRDVLVQAGLLQSEFDIGAAYDANLIERVWRQRGR